VVKSGRPKPG